MQAIDAPLSKFDSQKEDLESIKGICLDNEENYFLWSFKEDLFQSEFYNSHCQRVSRTFFHCKEKNGNHAIVDRLSRYILSVRSNGGELAVLINVTESKIFTISKRIFQALQDKIFSTSWELELYNPSSLMNLPPLPYSCFPLAPLLSSKQYNKYRIEISSLDIKGRQGMILGPLQEPQRHPSIEESELIMPSFEDFPGHVLVSLLKQKPEQRDKKSSSVSGAEALCRKINMMKQSALDQQVDCLVWSLRDKVFRYELLTDREVEEGLYYCGGSDGNLGRYASLHILASRILESAAPLLLVNATNGKAATSHEVLCHLLQRHPELGSFKVSPIQKFSAHALLGKESSPPSLSEESERYSRYYDALDQHFRDCLLGDELMTVLGSFKTLDDVGENKKKEKEKCIIS